MARWLRYSLALSSFSFHLARWSHLSTCTSAKYPLRSFLDARLVSSMICSRHCVSPRRVSTAPSVGSGAGGNQQRAGGAASAGLGAWSQQRPQGGQSVPADAGFDVDLPAIVEPDLRAGRSDDLDVPDFLK